ncbi:hypothetical protein LTR36_002633 [Oleoguttula mirabilis]|uniref:Methyltransferase type 11 domain-containing protein n=1 Tax=Oleoguttula mirabilis TaxID=1507867 RepID=A0AAV9JK78_9PEZI|nr:hypothetical protein LTR36_002633 [Oleoguttula mirabilis]
MTQLSDIKGDDWERLASEYTKISSNTTIAPIGIMLDRANALSPFSEAFGILDNGCGPGPVMSRLIKDYGTTIPRSCSLTCSDFSEGMLKQVMSTKEKSDAASPWKRVETLLQNAMDLGEIADESQTHVTAGLVYFMTPDPRKCLSESRRVLKEGGVLSLSSWEGSQWMELLKLVAKVWPDKQLPTLPEEWSSTTAVEGELKKAGFRDVESYRVPVEMSFESQESIVEFLVTKLPHVVAMSKDKSEEDVARLKRVMVDEAKKMCPAAPGKLDGVAIVGIGRK